MATQSQKVLFFNIDIAFHYTAKRLYVYLFCHMDCLKDSCPSALRFNNLTFVLLHQEY